MKVQVYRENHIKNKPRNYVIIMISVINNDISVQLVKFY